jgi:hypothetical protein
VRHKPINTLRVNTKYNLANIVTIVTRTYFFAMSGTNDPFASSCIAIACGVVAIIINSSITTRYGYRRVFLMTGLTVCGICQLILAAVYNAAPGTDTTGKVIVAFTIIYIMSYNVSETTTEDRAKLTTTNTRLKN